MKKIQLFFNLFLGLSILFSCENKSNEISLNDSIKKSSLTKEVENTVEDDGYNKLKAIDKEFTDCFNNSDQFEKDEVSCKAESTKAYESYLKTRLAKVGENTETKTLSSSSKQVLQFLESYMEEEGEFIRSQFNEDEQDITHQNYMVDELHFIYRSYALLLNEVISGENQFMKCFSNTISKEMKVSYAYLIAPQDFNLTVVNNRIDSLNYKLIDMVEGDKYQYHFGGTKIRKDLEQSIINFASDIADIKKYDENKKKELVRNLGFALAYTQLVLAEKYHVNR